MIDLVNVCNPPCYHITGSCTHVDIGEMEGKDTVHYLPQQTTVCFTCPALQRSSPSLVANKFYWSLGDSRLSVNQTALEGRVFPNGTLLIVNSSQTFSTDNSTKISCTNGSQTTELPTATIYLGGNSEI